MDFIAIEDIWSTVYEHELEEDNSLRETLEMAGECFLNR